MPPPRNHDVHVVNLDPVFATLKIAGAMRRNTGELQRAHSDSSAEISSRSGTPTQYLGNSSPSMMGGGAQPPYLSTMSAPATNGQHLTRHW